MKQINEKRTITKIYIVHPIKSEKIIRICSNHKLAEHYRRLLIQEYEEEHNKPLTISTYDLIHFTNEKADMSEEDIQYQLKKTLNKIKIIKEIVND